MQEWQRQKGSKGKGFGLLVCRRSASAVTSRGLHPGQFAARGRAGQVAPWAARCRSCSSRGQRTCAAECLRCHFAPWAARCRSCSSRGQRTCAGVAPQAIRGAWPRGTSRACGSSLRSCSSRGQRTCAGVAPQAIRGAWPRGTSRACGSSLRSCSSNRQRTCAAGAVCCPAAPGLCDGKSALCVSIPQKEKRPAAVAAGLSLYRGAPGRYSISQQSSHTPS